MEGPSNFGGIPAIQSCLGTEEQRTSTLATKIVEKWNKIGMKWGWEEKTRVLGF